MSTVNFNDSTPAAPSGAVNLKWQSDASGNISAYNSVGSWQTWAPTLTMADGMTASGFLLAIAEWTKTGSVIQFALDFTVTLGGTAAGYFFVNLPAGVSAADSTFRALAAQYSQPGVTQPQAMAASVQGGSIIIFAPNGAAFPLEQIGFAVSGSFHSS